MCALFHHGVCCHCNEVYLAIFCGGKYDHTFAKLFFQLISEITQSVHVYAVYLCRKQFDTFYFNDLIHDIAKRLSCRLAL